MDAYTQIDIAVVVAIAALLVMLSLALSFLAMRRMDDPDVRGGMAWLSVTNLCFLAATVALQARGILPFWASAALVVAGAHLGILTGHAAILRALGRRPRPARIVALAGLVVGLQAGLAVVWQSVEMLFLSSSLLNGTIAGWLAWRLWPAALPLGRAQAWLATLPLVAIALAYLGRVPAVAILDDPRAAILATLLIVFVLAVAALQWGFTLISFAAARLNRRLRTERERADEANRLKIRFLSNMSHELRTPLNGILGMAQALQAELPAGPGQEMARTIGQSGESLLQLLTDILDLSDLKGGRVTLAKATLVPAALLSATAGAHRDRAGARGLELVLDAGPGLGRPMAGDARRLRQRSWTSCWTMPSGSPRPAASPFRRGSCPNPSPAPPAARACRPCGSASKTPESGSSRRSCRGCWTRSSRSTTAPAASMAGPVWA